MRNTGGIRHTLLRWGLGTASIFTLVHAVIPKPLAVANPSELFRLGKETHCCDYGGFSQSKEYSIVSYDLYKQFQNSIRYRGYFSAGRPGSTNAFRPRGSMGQSSGDPSSIFGKVYNGGLSFGAPAPCGEEPIEAMRRALLGASKSCKRENAPRIEVRTVDDGCEQPRPAVCTVGDPRDATGSRSLLDHDLRSSRSPSNQHARLPGLDRPQSGRPTYGNGNRG